MSEQHGYKHFPTWQYGYTLGPPTDDNGGNYTTFTDPSSVGETCDGDKKKMPSDDKAGNKIYTTAHADRKSVV